MKGLQYMFSFHDSFENLTLSPQEMCTTYWAFMWPMKITHLFGREQEKTKHPSCGWWWRPKYDMRNCGSLMKDCGNNFPFGMCMLDEKRYTPARKGLCLCAGVTPDARCPLKLFYHSSSSTGQGRRNITKCSWVKIRTGENHSLITVTVKSASTREISLIYYQSRIMRNKNHKNTFPPLLPSSQA